MSYSRMKEAERRLEAEVRKWFEQAKAIDSKEDREFGADKAGDELPQWVSNKLKRLDKLRDAKAKLEQEARQKAIEDGKLNKDGTKPTGRTGRPPKTPPEVPKDQQQRNFTDPESKIMKTHEGFRQAYNTQTAVDESSQVIVAHGVTNDANDHHELPGMLSAIEENCGEQTKELSADAGYCSEENLEELERRGINGYVATGRQRHGEASAAGAAKATKGTRRAKMRSKLRQGGYRSRYRLRKQTVEPVPGQVKHAGGFRQFLLRGLDKVRSEWSLICTAHNLKKLSRALA